MYPILSLLAVALFSTAISTAAEPAASAKTTAKATAFKAGDPFPTEGLPTTWLRGKPVRSMDNGIAYVITRWNTRGFRVAPGHNIVSALEEVGSHPRIQAMVLFENDDIPREKLDRLLAYPSHRNTLPLADATVPENLAAELWLSRMMGSRINTVVVRDGRVLWAGSGFDLKKETLLPFLSEKFSYEQYEKDQAAYKARLQELMQLIMKDYPAAMQEQNTARADAILEELKAEENLHPFIGMRLYDALFQRELNAKDIPGALATMQAMVDAYPNEKGVHSWAHKVINSCEPTLLPGQAQSGRAAARVAELRDDHISIHWWRSAAEHFLKAGDKPAALAALESAEKASKTYKRLQTYLAAEKPKESGE